MESKIHEVTVELDDTKGLLTQEKKANQSLCQELAAEREKVARAEEKLVQGASVEAALQEAEDRLKDSSARIEELNAKLQELEAEQLRLAEENSKLKSKFKNADMQKASSPPKEIRPGGETEV